MLKEEGEKRKRIRKGNGKKSKKKYSGITISSPSEGGGTRAEMQVFKKKKT